jgi:RHS repeat-associated protein
VFRHCGVLGGSMMRSYHWNRIFFLALSLLFLSCCEAHAQAPTITSMSPTSGPVGIAVTLTGTNFGSSQGSSTISLNGTNALATNWTTTSITAIVPTGASTGTFSVRVNNQTAQSATFTVTALPSGWSDGDIGTVGVTGSASYANGVFTVQGGGQQIYGTSDGFNFAYQSMSGDGTILARLVSVQGASGYATVGVMIRETLNAGSTNAKTSDWPAYSGIYFDLRSTTGGGTSEPGGRSTSLPYWVKVARSGSTFSSFTSSDGVNWTQLGSNQTISMAQSTYVGLAVNSGTTSGTATATFDSVSISPTSSPAPSITSISPTSGVVGAQVTITGTGFGSSQNGSLVTFNNTPASINSWSSTSIVAIVPAGATTGPLLVSLAPSMNDSNVTNFTVTLPPPPSPWVDQDIGTVGVAGGDGYSNGTFTVKGAGGGTLATNSDGLNFVYQSLSGDGWIVARVVSAQGSGSQEEGVMIRETLDPGASNAQMLYYAYLAGFNMTQRSSTGATSSGYVTSQAISVNPAYWVKLVRSGSTFSGYASSDGETWTQVGSSQTISMATNVYIGLFASNRNTSALATATFDSVSVSSSANPAPVISSITPTTASVGSQVLITGSGFGATQSGSLVTLNNLPMTVNDWTATGIVITVASGATTGPLLVSVAPSMNNSNASILEVTSQPLPSSWVDDDLGQIGILGGASYSNGTYTIQGAGGGTLVTAADGIHFVYQPLSGDGSIVARVVSTQGGGSQEAGVMIRETLDPGGTNAQMFYYAGGPGFNLTQRTSTGATSGGYASAQAVAVSPPYWVKLVRSGSTFTGYASLDGVNWLQVGSSQTISMATNVYLGLYVSNRNTGGLATGTFDGVSISPVSSPAPVITSVSATTGTVGSQVTINGTGFGASEGSSVVTLNNAAVTINSWSNTSIVITIPSGATTGYLLVSIGPSMNSSNPVRFVVTTQPLPTPWVDQEIGQVGSFGSGTYASGTFTVKGAGQGLYSTSDSFHFVYQPLQGDGSIVVRIVSSTALSGDYPEAVVTIRETLNPGAAEVSVGYYSYPSPYIYVFQRTSTGGSTSSSNYVYLPSGLPYWVKLIRNGNTFSEYASPDGVTWTQLGSSQTITMATNVYIGMTSDSGYASDQATSTFDNQSVTVGSTPIVTGVSPSLGGAGTSVTVSGSNFGSSQGSSTIKFNGTLAASVTSWSSTQIVATVAGTTPVGPGPVTVTVNSVTSPGTVNFTMIKPVLSSLTPPAAQTGGVITLSGSNFGANQGSNQVQFNGVSATVTSWSDTSITAAVPTNATSGPVTVVEDGVTSNGVQFTVLEALTVTGLSTTLGPAGSTVTITGTGFGGSQSNSTVVFFPGVTATVNSWSDTQISATIPVAASGPVGVGVATEYAFGPTFYQTFLANLTDSLNNQTTYTSEQIGGQWVPLNVQGSGCSSCTERGTISYTYDANGNALTRTDENGHTTTYTYDSNNNALTVTVPISSNTTATTTYTYNSLGEVLTATDPLGNVTTNTYDAKGNLSTLTTPAPNGNTGASVTQFAYNSLGELTSITDPLNNVTLLTYTSAGLVATIKDAQNNTTTYGYDAHGNRSSVTDALNHQTTFTYDSMDRLTKITYPDTTTTQFGYDYRGRRTSVTDQNGKATSYTYDDADRLITATDAANNVTTYGYDTENNLTSIKDANNHTTSFTYDAFARVTKTTFPSGNFETYSYDAVGNLTGKTDRKNQLISYTYDQLNRMTQKTYSDSTTVNYTYDNDSRLTQVTDPTGTYSFTFDNMGRLTGTTTSYAFLTGRNFTTAYSYDAASNRTGFTDPESGSTIYAYDTLNRLQTLTPPAAISSGNFGFTYDALSRRTQMTRPNGLKSVYAYDNLSRLLSVLHQSGTNTLDGAAYAVDNAGNRTSRTPQPSGTAANFGYDNIYELLSATQGGTTTESYTYDAVGNRLSSLNVSSYSYNSSNELTSAPSTTYTYDNDGNLVTKVDSTGTTQYFWDFENRLSSVTLPGSGGTVQFKYDPFGRRIYKSSSSGTSVFAYDSDNLVEETNSSGTAVARYSQGLNIDEPLAMLRSGATSFYHADGLGSVTSLSNTSGSIAQTYTFDSFGKLTASTGSLTNSFRYTAREFDAETSLYYYRARYYDANTGRFSSEDPFGFRGGDINFYVYVDNSSPNFWDPFGLTTWPTNYPVVTDPFGTIEPIRGGRIHTGEDIRNPMGGVVCASDSGTVIAIRHADIGGDQIVIHNDDGSMSGYAHTGSVSGLSVGQHVNEGQIIGNSNGSGNVHPHLHYTYRECPSCPQVDPQAHLPSPAQAKPCGEGKCK